MLRVGVVGFGFMGRMHFRCWDARADAQVVAVCDANPNIKEDARRAVGNIDGAASAIDFSGIEVFTDFDSMLEKAQLDAISLTLPTFPARRIRRAGLVARRACAYVRSRWP